MLALLPAFAGALQHMPRAAPARGAALRSAVVSAVDRTNWETSGRDLILKSEDGTSDIVFDAEHAPAGGDPAAIVFLPPCSAESERHVFFLADLVPQE